MRRLAASFVAIVGCRSNHPHTDHYSPARVSKTADGGCVYRPAGPSGGNPPAYYDVECPPDLGGPSESPRLPGRVGWLRMQPWAHRNDPQDVCIIFGEGFCPPVGSDGQCDQAKEIAKVSCKLAVDTLSLDAFEWTDSVGTCHRVEAFSCKQTCRIPDGVPCAK